MKDFIPYQEALELKQLGFKERCFGHYWENLFYFETTFNHPSTIPNSPESCLVPTYSQAFRWFREQHKHVSAVRTYFNVDFFYEIYVSVSHEITSDSYNTYEEAELACLREMIKIIKEKQK